MSKVYSRNFWRQELARTKREGLKEFYGIEDERAVSFFRVHEGIDVLHQQIERQILSDKCRTADEQRKAVEVVKESAKALWTVLDGVTAAYVTA